MAARHLSVSTTTDAPTCPAPQRQQDLVLRSPRNWTPILFIAGLSGLHLFIAIPGLYNHRWASFLSAAFGVIFACAALACCLLRSEIIFDSRNRRIRLRTALGRFGHERSIGFQDVHGVRLMVEGKSPRSSRIEILCDNEDLECPPTPIPRQQALCLALLMQVRLIKVYGDITEPRDEVAEFHRV